MVGFALEFHALPARESQIRPVPGAALALTVATLAIVHHQRFAADFITDRAAGASAGVSLAHAFSPYSAVGSLRGHRARSPTCRKACTAGPLLRVSSARR